MDYLSNLEGASSMKNQEIRQVWFFETGFGEGAAELKIDGAHEGLQSCTYHNLIGEWELVS